MDLHIAEISAKFLLTMMRHDWLLILPRVRLMGDKKVTGALSSVVNRDCVRRVMGRKRINIQPIQGDRNRTTTYIKRKAGLFKKAHELAVLTDSDVAVLVFSRNGKLAEFCSSDMDELLLRYTEYSGTIERRGPEHFASVNNESSYREPLSSPRHLTKRRNTSILATMRARIDNSHVDKSQQSHQTFVKVERAATQQAASPVTQDGPSSQDRVSPPITVQAPRNESQDWNVALQRSAHSNISRTHSDNALTGRLLPDRGPIPRRWPQSVDLGLLRSPADSGVTNPMGQGFYATDVQVPVSQQTYAQQAPQTPATCLHITPTMNGTPDESSAVSLSMPVSPMSSMHPVQNVSESLLLNRSYSCPNTTAPLVASLDQSTIPIPSTLTMESQPQLPPFSNSLSPTSSSWDGAQGTLRSADATDLSQTNIRMPVPNTQALSPSLSTVSPLMTNSEEAGLDPQMSLHGQHPMTPTSILFPPPSYPPVPHTM